MLQSLKKKKKIHYTIIFSPMTGFHQSLYLYIYIYLHSGSTCSKSMSNKSKLLLIRPHNQSFIFLFLKVKRFFLFFVCESLHFFFHFDDNFEIVWYTTISVSVTQKNRHLNLKKKMSRTNCFLSKKCISDSLSVLFRCSIFKNILSLILLYSQPAHSAFLIFHQGVVLKFLNGPYASLSLSVTC